jgi:hypothetical protein
VLSPATGLLSPSLARNIPTNLTPAPGRQDHTTSSYASATLVSRDLHVHRIPRPTSVTIAIRPSCERETGELVAMICPSAKAEYFLKVGWTGKR